MASIIRLILYLSLFYGLSVAQIGQQFSPQNQQQQQRQQQQQPQLNNQQQPPSFGPVNRNYDPSYQYTTPSSQNGTAPQSTCPASLKSLPSDPAYQSGLSSIILTSTTDYSEYLCIAGIGYEGTGISCYAIKCQSSPGQYGPTYGPNGYYPQAGVPGFPKGVGQLVGQAETAYPCWKLKQIRLNNYVYLVCFVKKYASLIFQVAFKENGIIALLPSETLPYSGLTAVGKSQFTAENGFVCVLAVYSSSPSVDMRDKKTEPSDLLAPMYTICPNNYKWYFCGNINIESTVDVTVWYSQAAIHAVFVQTRDVSTCNAANAIESKFTLTPVVQYSISPNIELYECSSKQEAVIHRIGRPVEEVKGQEYSLCGVRQCIVASGQNGTILCCSVTTDFSCPIPDAPPTDEPYSSFCIPFNVITNQYNVEKIVFLGGSERANDIQYVRANGECCQFIITANPSGPLAAYPLASIIANLNNQTAPVTLPPTDLGAEHMFSHAVTCSYKSRCCNSLSTCVTCTRPAKYGDKYFGSLMCGNVGISNPFQTYSNPNIIITEDGVPYANGPARNYSAVPAGGYAGGGGGAYGQAVPMPYPQGPYQQAGPYAPRY